MGHELKTLAVEKAAGRVAPICTSGLLDPLFRPVPLGGAPITDRDGVEMTRVADVAVTHSNGTGRSVADIASDRVAVVEILRAIVEMAQKNGLIGSTDRL